MILKDQKIKILKYQIAVSYMEKLLVSIIMTYYQYHPYINILKNFSMMKFKEFKLSISC